MQESQRLNKELNKEVWRERHLRQKAERALEDAIEAAAKASQIFDRRAEEKRQQIQEKDEEIADLQKAVEATKKELQHEKAKTKSELLKEYREDIRRLQQSKLNNKASIELWRRKRDEQKKSCQTLGLYKMASVSKKKLQKKNKRLQEKIKQKLTGQADMKKALEEAIANRDYWEDQHCILLEEIKGESVCMHAYV